MLDEVTPNPSEIMSNNNTTDITKNISYYLNNDHSYDYSIIDVEYDLNGLHHSESVKQ